MGCDQAQGYAISKPIPADTVSTWLSDYRPKLFWTDYQNSNLTPQGNKILLLQLTTQYWFNTTNKSLLSQGLNIQQSSMQSQLTIWLTRIEESLFNETCLRELKQLYTVMFELACELISQHQMAQVTEAQTRIAELEKTYQAVSFQINKYHQFESQKSSIVEKPKEPIS